MGRGRKIINTITTNAQRSVDAPLRLPLIELVGYRRLLVENHRGVVQYSNSLIQIKVCYGVICIQGKGLSLAHMSVAQLVVVGCIDCISLSREI